MAFVVSNKVLLACVLCLPALLASVASRSKRDNGISGFVIGGREAASNQFPQVVSVQNNGQRHCGGAILDKNWVLTAAHCVDGMTAADMSVLAGTTDTEGGNGVRVQASRIIKHADFTMDGPGELSSFLPHDIALIELEESLPLGDSVRIAPLQHEDTSGGEDVVIAGWGAAATDDLSTVRHLKYAELKVITNEDCGNHLGNVVGADQMCADAPNNDQNSCGGDSGGPLFHKGHVVGLVSYSTAGCTVGDPTVYTNVYHHLDWIRENTGLDV